jgi:drug/metabolite transporter (DMT)-like permease
MVYLVTATLLGFAIFVVFRLFKKFGIDNLHAITANYAIAATVSFLSFDSPVSTGMVLEASWFPLVLIIGVLFIGVFFLFAHSAQKAGVAVTAVSSKMSVAIPAAGGFIFFSEASSLLKIAGIVAALLAFYLTFRKKDQMISDWKTLYLPVFLFLGTGLNDLLMKTADYHYIENDLLLLLSVIFSVALVIGVFMLTYKLWKNKNYFDPKSLAAGVLLGLINFGSTYFLFKSMEHFDSSLMFPVRNTGIVVLSALAGYFVFAEKLNRTNWLGILLAVVAILLVASG